MQSRGSNGNNRNDFVKKASQTPKTGKAYHQKSINRMLSAAGRHLTNMAPRRLSTSLQRSIKDHERVLRRVTQTGGKRLLKFVPKTFFPLIKKIFQSIKNGTIPVPFNLNRSLLDKVVRAKNSERVIVQNGSGIVSILAQVVPALAAYVIPKIVKLFKKKKN